MAHHYLILFKDHFTVMQLLNGLAIPDHLNNFRCGKTCSLGRFLSGGYLNLGQHNLKFRYEHLQNLEDSSVFMNYADQFADLYRS